MKWIIVTAMISGGQLSFTETYDYPTKEECKRDVSRLLDLYMEDHDLEQVYLECYMVEDRK